MENSVYRMLSEARSIGGGLILKPETAEENWARSSLWAVNYQLIRFATVEAEKHDNKYPYIFAIAETLRANFNNPIHYGDNRPGTFTSLGKAVAPDPVFTFWDLWQYGTTGEDGFNGFIRDSGLPKATTEQSVIAVIGLLLVDDALAAMEVQRLSWASHLLSQAKDCAEEALLHELLQTKEEDIRSAIQEAISARGVHAMKARYAKDTDGKQAAKKWVKECWRDWKAKPEKYKNASAFARDMLDKQPDRLTTEVVVSRWVRDWEKEKIAS